jgi:hypothetical protein
MFNSYFDKLPEANDPISFHSSDHPAADAINLVTELWKMGDFQSMYLLNMVILFIAMLVSWRYS